MAWEKIYNYATKLHETNAKLDDKVNRYPDPYFCNRIYC